MVFKTRSFCIEMSNHEEAVLTLELLGLGDAAHFLHHGARAHNLPDVHHLQQYSSWRLQ